MPIDETTASPTRRVLEYFWEIASIPRCSGAEQGVAQFLLNWAAEEGFSGIRDAAGNVCLRIPGRTAHPGAPIVILQAHMDMVCIKEPGHPHDFTSDPIRPVIQDEWLRANGTSLGADNGIGIALALALTSGSTPHPPLELLFTVDEERGLSGAMALSPDFIQGRILINLDSEDEGVLTIGCAGGRDGGIRMPLERTRPRQGEELLSLILTGLAGGHSGVEIQRQNGNAIQILAAILQDAVEDGTTSCSPATLRGGTARNAIPAEATATLYTNNPETLFTQLSLSLDRYRPLLPKEDRGVKIERVTGTGIVVDPLSPNSAITLLRLLSLLPHGVFRTSDLQPGLVETSANLARLDTLAEECRIQYSLRSFLPEAMDLLERRFIASAELAGAVCQPEAGYPGWVPDFTSPLLTKAQQIYRNTFGAEPVSEVIHAGLECGVIKERIPEMAMLSMGPTIQKPHTPEERLHLPSLDRFRLYLDCFLAEMAK